MGKIWESYERKRNNHNVQYKIRIAKENKRNMGEGTNRDRQGKIEKETLTSEGLRKEEMCR